MTTRVIDGLTRLYGIVGDPVSAVRSPEVFNAMFERQGVNAVMVALHVGADELATAWAGLKALRNLAGLVITMPHKVAATTLVDDLGQTGRIVGAINAARREPDGRWTGDMFDGRGCVQGLRVQGHQVAGRKAFLLGVGGAGAAIAVALAEAGIGTLVVQDLETAKRDRVVAMIAADFPGVAVSAGGPGDQSFDLAINATPLGMKAGDPLPFDPGALPASTLVVDVVPKPEMTPMLERAAATGHRIQSGRHMHLGQAVGVARFFGYAFDD